MAHTVEGLGQADLKLAGRGWCNLTGHFGLCVVFVVGVDECEMRA